MNKYRKVEIVSLKDNKNLSYRTDCCKEIAIAKPYDYSPLKQYKVLYGFDGQNFFSRETVTPYNPPFGCWECDIALSEHQFNCDGVILVGIFNGEGESIRDSELTMSTAFGELTSLAEEGQGFKNGHLDELGDFIKDTVIPYIDNRFSTINMPSGRAIFGSSSGGLAAYYLGLRDNIYGTIGAFSPAIGLFNSSSWLSFYSKMLHRENYPDIFLYCGYGDILENLLIKDVKNSVEQLKNLSYSGKIVESYADAKHNEEVWRKVFPDFLSLLNW